MAERPTGRHPAGAPRSPATRRRPGTLRAAAPAQTAQKNNLPIILGCVGGGILLIILIAVVAGGGDGKGTNGRRGSEGETALAPEEQAKRKCERGIKTCKAALPKLARASGAEKDRLRDEIEEALKTIDAGIATLKKISPADAPAYEEGREDAALKWAYDVEREGGEKVDEGVRVLNGMKSLMSVDTDSLTSRQRAELREGLEKGMRLIEQGNRLYDRSNMLTGHTFDNVLGGDYKLAKMKLLELK